MSKFAAVKLIAFFALVAFGLAACGVATPSSESAEAPEPTVPIATQAPLPETPTPIPTPEISPSATFTLSPSVTPGSTEVAKTLAARPTSPSVHAPTPPPESASHPTPTATPVPKLGQPPAISPTSTPFPVEATPAPANRGPTPTLTPEPPSELSGLSWAWDGLTRIERETLYYLERIQRRHPPAFETVVGHKWLADETITEGERRVLCHISQAQDATAALAIAQTAGPIESPSEVDWDDCPPASQAPPPPPPVSSPTATSVPDSWVSIGPSRGSPGDLVTVSGGNFPSSTGIPVIDFGGVSVIPLTYSQAGPGGGFVATLHVPNLSPGRQSVIVTVGDLRVSMSFLVGPLQPTATPHSGKPQPEGEPVASALTALSGYLLWVAYFNSQTQTFSVYDPGRSFSPSMLPLAPGQSAPNPSDIGVLTHLLPGGIYLVSVRESVTIRGQSLPAGTTLMVWPG